MGDEETIRSDADGGSILVHTVGFVAAALTDQGFLPRIVDGQQQQRENESHGRGVWIEGVAIIISILSI